MIIADIRMTEPQQTVGSEMAKPSCSSSPWMRGAPQPGLPDFMRRIDRQISSLTLGRPSRRERSRQDSLNPARCQETSVPAFTMIGAPAQPVQERRSAIQKNLCGSR